VILIIDNYDSFTYNLVHLVAAHSVHYEVHRNDQITLEQVRRLDPFKILISPGPGRPENAGITPDLIREFGPTIPILGVCLGHQAIGMVYGGEVVYAPSLMHGKTSVIHHDEKTIFRNVPQDFTATRYHSLVLHPETLPEVLEVSSYTPDGVIMGVRHREYPVEGIQFHPESILTIEGPKLIANWIQN
jgi:anthranilate synthase/aminodeoxychorismate synthase-like glutamine amidotransferase